MKFIDSISRKEKTDMKKHYPELCPFKRSCYPVAVHLGVNGAGACSGIIHKSDNLDCIRLCLFYEDLANKEKDIKIQEHFMTPTEALEAANALVWAAGSSLLFASSYKKFCKELDRARKNGDRMPSQY